MESCCGSVVHGQRGVPAASRTAGASSVHGALHERSVRLSCAKASPNSSASVEDQPMRATKEAKWRGAAKGGESIGGDRVTGSHGEARVYARGRPFDCKTQHKISAAQDA